MPLVDREARREYHRLYMKKYLKRPIPKKKHLVRVRARKIDPVGPKFCPKCKTNVPERHHPDYDDRDHIEWLCRKCHLEEHGQTYTTTRQTLICVLCKNKFDRLCAAERSRKRKGRAGPFCGRSCATKYTNSLRGENGRFG